MLYNSYKRTILVVDDSSINRQILCKLLDKDYSVIEACNGIEALKVLGDSSNTISAVLLDLNMPQMDGYEVIKVMKNDIKFSSIPIIVSTSSDDDETENKALELGANDFLRKPFKQSIILHRIKNTIDLCENAKTINAIEKDSLTNVYTKEFFYKRVQDILNNNPDKEYDIACVDIERFKLVNDLYGVEVGNNLLKYMAQVIERYTGNEGICGRINADAFVCCISHQDEDHYHYFEDACKEIKKFPLDLKIYVKIGIYVVDDKSVPVSAMCDRAMLTCDSIKGKYNTFYAHYDNKLRQSLIFEQSVVDDVTVAFKTDQFIVYYQPKYDINTEKVVGAEALVRWIHPVKGFMSPGDFIPVFEKNGFITKLDMYVWEKVCADIKRWQDNNMEVVPISVNVSRADIFNTKLIDVLSGLVKKYNINPKYLHLEITESAYTENQKQIIDTIVKLKAVGFIIEMDDFGSGYSSLNMLSELPIDVLKVDMKFVKIDSTNSRNKVGILEFVINLAKLLKLPVIAEGVETKDQLDTLRDMNCDFVQGYYYAKPMPVEEYENHIKGKVSA